MDTIKILSYKVLHLVEILTRKEIGKKQLYSFSKIGEFSWKMQTMQKKKTLFNLKGQWIFHFFLPYIQTYNHYT